MRAVLLVNALILAIGLAGLYLTSCVPRTPYERDFTNLKHLSDAIEKEQHP